jgi:hypothetical protein
MNGSEDLHELSMLGFASYAKVWPTESTDYVSLSKYSIWALLKQAVEIKGTGLALYLRAVALKREHEGASRFIFWSFADAHAPPREATALELESEVYGIRYKSKPKKLFDGILVPTGEPFRAWLANKSSGADLKVPTWDLPLLADYADEFLHLAIHLEPVSQEFDSTFLNQSGGKGGVSLAQAVDEFVYFNRRTELISLARQVLGRAVAEHRENPVDFLLQAFEGIGLATRRTLSSEDLAKSKHSTSPEAQQSEDKNEAR